MGMTLDPIGLWWLGLCPLCSEDIRYFIALGVPDSLIGKISYALISIVQFIFVQVWKFVVGKLSESVELAAIQI
jgi:hypothetical protein